ncbi:MAG: indolepyruvate ferredoxin oxidoreductase subunit alpha, partial [Candidatus Thorarchaeota archaeon]
MTVEDVKRVDKGPALMLSNEAIVRAALEADVKVTAFYPGSPTSEILDTFSEVLDHFGDFKTEISANEKVALETVAGASMAGLRSFTSMKSVGMNVASDSMFSIGYTG